MPLARLHTPSRLIALSLAVLTAAGCAAPLATSATETTVPVAATAAVTTTMAPTTTPAPVCTVTVEPGDAMIAIANRTGITVEQLQSENSLDETTTIHPGEVFDICPGNDIDDVTGTQRSAPPVEAVTVQQNALNALLKPYSLEPLVVDGDSGKYTRQALCVARMGLGLPVHNGHLTPGSEEEKTILAATALSLPAGAPTDAKWLLIDQTCQVIVTGESDQRIVDIYPTSTGQPGFETRTVSAKAFRFDPALDNEGWHDSSTFPVKVDNKLNGNMYKPIYFNEGQAVHGAGYIPPEPKSKGCARTYPKHQDAIIAWLGLDTLTESTWSTADIGLTVTVRGRYVDRP